MKIHKFSVFHSDTFDKDENEKKKTAHKSRNILRLIQI